MGDGCDGAEDDPSKGVRDVSLSPDAILSILAHPQRRDVLSVLRAASDHTATLDECVTYVVRQEEKRTGTRPGHDLVEASLHHVHVPKLVDAGIVEYDARSQEMRYWSHDGLESWLDRLDADSPGE